MNKIFGYTKRNGNDWFKSDPYAEKEIEAIVDPDGGAGISRPTAIPSPFARIDLVKTAFKNISRTEQLRNFKTGNTVVASVEDEKLVSDALDLAEILFNIDNLDDRIQLLTWNRQQELQKLRDGLDEHRRLAETLELYFLQDEASYNFDKLENLYLVVCDHKVIGCTSPATLFFASGNDLSHARISLMGNDISFDHTYTPLYERDEQFQKYLYLLFIANPILKSRMRQLDDYLVKSLSILETSNPILYDTIKRLQAGDLKRNYTELDNGTSGRLIEVLGVPLYKRKTEDLIATLGKSDFVISSVKYTGGNKPLVLQNFLGRPNFRYANDLWDNTVTVPYEDPESNLERRKLPKLSVQFPYLTVSDFLEPILVRLIYPVQKDKFFDGNTRIDTGDDTKGYLLPLKPLFFHFFDADDLLAGGPGNPSIQMLQGTAGSVKVILKIPVQKQEEFISFERIYYSPAENTLLKPAPANNKGAIVEHQIGLTLYPFIKIQDPAINPNYRIQFIDRDVFGIQKDANFELAFFRDKTNKEIIPKSKKARRSKTVDGVGSHYYVLKESFDYIQLKNKAHDGANAFIIPKWSAYQPGSETYHFAVDFGTTNTHIEYKNNDIGPVPFDIKATDTQIGTLFNPDRIDYISRYSADDIYTLIEYEFIPRLIGNNEEYSFPHRTVIAESRSLNIDMVETFTLADLNIPFVYERKEDIDRIQSNLKWARKEDGNKKRVHAYLENLMMLMRNKVLFGKGNLAQTRLTWFYPSSMTVGRKGQLESEWRSLFEEYFNSAHLISMTESLAPFYYFKGSNMLTGAYKPVVSVDIGGGTTDVVVFKSNEPLIMTSFKFAANSLFGDAYSEFGAANANKMIGKYLPYFQRLLQSNNHFNLAKVLEAIKEKNKSEDINAFFFSIENNPAISSRQLYAYNSLLSNDEDLKIVFIYFYTAIVYHIAELMKNQRIGLPKHMIFSGTGSKILKIITTDMKILDKLSQNIFESVYKEKFDEDGFNIKTEKDIPKEVTCKGGLMADGSVANIEVDGLRKILTGLEDETAERLTYEKLDEKHKESIVRQIKNFNVFFMKLNKDFSFKTNFNVSAAGLEVFSKEMDKHVRDFLEEGISYNRKMNEVSSGEIEETLFFYPLIGTINLLINELAAISNIIH